MPSQSFSAGTGQTFTVPSDIPLLHVDLLGAGGQDGQSGSVTAAGGEGGRTTGALATTGGEDLEVNVGATGNGGASGTASGTESGAGGASTDVRQGDTALGDRKAVAAGGGGGGAADDAASRGGQGGPDTGEDAPDTSPPNEPGTADGGHGGTQDSGGTGFPNDGSLLDGGDGSGNTSSDALSAGGGGGDGLYGGGGGGTRNNNNEGAGAGGGGGSNYDDDLQTVVRNERGTGGSANSDGSATIKWITLTATVVSGDQVDLSWDDLGESEANYEILRSETTGTTAADYTVIDTVGADTTSYSDTGREDGERYFYRVRAIDSGGSGLATSDEDDATTSLPAPTIDSIDNSTEDELTVNWTKNDDSSDGEFELFRSTDGSLGTKIKDAISLGTSSFADTGLDDGEKYHYTLRRITDHTQADSAQVSQTTILPAPTDFSKDDFNQDTVTFSWTDNTDNEDGYRVLKSTDGGSTFSQDGSDLDPDTTTYTTTVLSPDTYLFKVRAFTEDTTADSSTVEHTVTGLPVRETRPTDWHVEIEHPTTGNILRPTVVGKPTRHPKVNDLPEISIPVKRSEKWQDSGLEGATMRVWYKGVRQPIDELETVEVTPSGTVLSGRGGLELLNRVQAEYDQQEIHTAIQNLIQNNTSYTANVDTPTATTSTNKEIDSATTDAEFQQRTNIKRTDPVAIQNGNIELLQSAFHQDARDASGSYGTTSASEGGSSDYVDGTAAELNSASHRIEASFTTLYDIPEDRVGLAIRQGADDALGVSYRIDGQEVDFLDESTGQITFDWDQVADAVFNGGGWTGGTLEAGSHTVEIEVTGLNSGEVMAVDWIVLYDTKYSYTFDNTTDSNNELSGPEKLPDAHTVVFDQVKTVDSVTGGRIESSWTDTTGSQALALSNDQGDSYKSTSNASNFETDFSSKGPSLKPKVTLSRFGSQSETPTSGVDGQHLQNYTLKADLDSTPLIVNQSIDDRLINVIQEFADLGDFVSAYERDGLTESVEWTQPGQRTSSKEPSVATYDVTKSTAETVEKVGVYGSSQRIVGETFTANHGTAVSLASTRLQQGKEVVTDPDTGTQFVRGDDYTMDYDDGQITTLSGGDITDGSTYSIEYVYQTFGEYDDGTSDPDERVVEIPALTTNSACEQAAKRIVEGVGPTDGAKDPLWESRVVVPTDETGWSVVDEIDIADVPTGGARHIRDVENTPGQVVLLLGSRETIQDYVADTNARLGTVSRKV